MIRTANSTDLIKIIDLIDPYIDEFSVNSDGRRKFSSSIIQSMLENPMIHYFVYQQTNEIVGIIAYKEPSHIVHFFVDKQYQGKGIGRQLWNHVEAIMTLNTFPSITVNSSCYAEKIYNKFGFESVSDVIEEDGLRFIRMQKNRL